MSKEYSNNETTVIWEPEKCVHSGICLMGLPRVFDLKNRPWVNMQGAPSDEIESTVARCPSGALSIKGKPQLRADKLVENKDETTEVTVVRGGPVIVSGEVTLKNPNGKTWKQSKDVAFCRCQHSKNFPFCDGSHIKNLKS